MIVDIGTGDGLFVYHRARQNPRDFHIGIDSNRDPLAGISEKIHRKISKGGAPNVIYLQATAEALPQELQAIASDVTVLFPWGSLLKGVATGDIEILLSIHRICAPAANLQVVVALDATKDQSEIRRLHLPDLNADYIESVLRLRYSAAGFVLDDVSWNSLSELSEIQTTWARKLKAGSRRVLWLRAHRKDSSE